MFYLCLKDWQCLAIANCKINVAYSPTLLNSINYASNDPVFTYQMYVAKACKHPHNHSIFKSHGEIMAK